jgi:hypothetical protein
MNSRRRVNSDVSGARNRRREMKTQLTQQEAEAMTVNERLSACELFKEFDDAIERRDVTDLRRILQEIYLPDDSVEAVIKQVLGTSGAVQQIGRERRERVSHHD